MNESTKKQPFYSIAIPTYNRANSYLKETLESALSQTYQDLEIFVSDNGSTDKTEELVNSYQDPRLKYYKHPNNIPYTDHWRFCIENSRGTYILLLHDDDAIDSDFVETCASNVKGNANFGFIRTGIRTFDESSKPQTFHENLSSTESSLATLALEWTQGKSTLYMPNIMYNKRFLIEEGGFYSKTNFYLDLAANFRLASKHKWLDIKDIKSSFRVGNASLGTKQKLDKIITDGRYITDLVCELEPNKEQVLRNSCNKYFSVRMLRYVDELTINVFHKAIYYHKINKTYDYYHSYVFLLRRLLRKTLKS